MRIPCALLLLIAIVSCGPRPGAYGRAAEGVVYEMYRADTLVAVRAELPDPSGAVGNYVPDTLYPELMPTRYVRINVHLMNTADTLFAYHGDYGREFVDRVVGSANELLAKTPELWLTPEGMEVPALPRRLQLVLATDPDTGRPAVYDHFDETNYAYLHKGNGQNRGDRGIVKKYAVRQDEEINVFAMAPPRDSLASPNFSSPKTMGIYVSGAIKLGDWMAYKRSPWSLRSVLVHEVLHALGLNHAWLRNDGCEDTPVHPNRCWDRSSRPGCDSLTSNNIMDYSYRQEALTPCQIGKVHAALSTPASRTRGYLRPDWCAPSSATTLVVTDSLRVMGARDLHGSIIVARGGYLYLADRMHLPTGAEIIVEPGGTLELGPNARLHNACENRWGGIRVGRVPGGPAGAVRVHPGATIVDAEP